MIQIFLVLICFLSTLYSIDIDRVIIWGHKLHSHTHSYIHEGFYKGFKHLGYPVYWFDDSNYPKNFDYSKTLFIVASGVDNKVPLREDSYYVFHHCWCKEHRCAEEKYKFLIEKNHAISIKCFWSEYLPEDTDWTKVDTYIYKSRRYKELVFPWATDLLPHEIEEEKGKLPHKNILNQVIYAGTIGNSGYGANSEELNGFFNAAIENKIKVIINDPWAHPISCEQYKKRTQESLLAPAIQGKWQCDVGYIPCRIFKNISYGKLGITNSKFVSSLFNDQIVFNENTKELFFDSLKALNTITLEKQLELMDFIKTKHTYINRISLILEFFQEIKNEK